MVHLAHIAGKAPVVMLSSFEMSLVYLTFQLGQTEMGLSVSSVKNFCL